MSQDQDSRAGSKVLSLEAANAALQATELYKAAAALEDSDPSTTCVRLPILLIDFSLIRGLPLRGQFSNEMAC